MFHHVLKRPPRHLQALLLVLTCVYATYAVCIYIYPHVVTMRHGLSFYAVLPRTKWPYAIGLSLAVAFSAYLVRVLPPSIPSFVKRYFVLQAVLLAGIVASPFNVSLLAHNLHVIFSSVLFISQCLLMVKLTLYLKKDAYSWLLTVAAGVIILVMSRYLHQPFARLIICQLLLQLLFGMLVYHCLSVLSRPRPAGSSGPWFKRVEPVGQKGFTIIELMFATAAFTTVLLICSAGMIYIGRLYYKGVSAAKTQAAARSVIDDISRPIQFSNDVPTPSPLTTTSLYWASTNITANVFCIGTQRYTYVVDWQQQDNPSTKAADKQIRHVLWRDTLKSNSTTTCTPADLTQANPSASDSNSTGDGREMLPQNMRLTKFNISRLTGSLELYQVDVWVVYGDEDLLNAPTSTGSRNCKDGATGTQFCALSELTTIVERRLK